MVDYRQKNQDGTETVMTPETHDNSKKVLMNMLDIVEAMQDKCAISQLSEVIVFCKTNEIRADEAVLLAIDGLYKNLQAIQDKFKQKKEQEEKTANMPKNLN